MVGRAARRRADRAAGTGEPPSSDYGGGWRWTIALEGTDPLLLTMHNVVPDDQATDDVEAGPYPVMLAELNRQT